VAERSAVAFGVGGGRGDPVQASFQSGRQHHLMGGGEGEEMFGKERTSEREME